jgi:hypothetical protein
MPRFEFSPDVEYSLLDLTVTAVRKDGARFPFSKGTGEQRVGLLEDFMYDGQPKSNTMGGSGPNPRAHTRIKNEPKCEATMPVDTATAFKKFVGDNGVVTMICTRRRPGGLPVTDHVFAWKPLFAGPSFKGNDAATRKVTGNALRVDEDVKGSIA